MMISRTHFDLADKIVFGRALFHPPFKAGEALTDEARFVCAINGRSRLNAPNIQMNINSSDSFIMKCENFVNSWQENENGEPTEVIIVHFYPEILKEVYGDLPEIFSSKKENNPQPVEKIETNKMIEHFIGSLQFYFENPTLITDELIKIKIKELIEILVSSDHTGKVKSILSDLFRSNEYEFKEIIHSNLFEDLSLHDLALFSGLSLSSFKRKFNTVFGTSPTRYIKAKRLEKAQSLLQMTSQRISEIAYDCGFNDVAYFSKAFSSAYNCSPTEYRKRYLS